MRECLIMAPGGSAHVSARIAIGKSVRTVTRRYMPAAKLIENAGGLLEAAVERVQRMLAADGIELKRIGDAEFTLAIDGPLEACEALELVTSMIKRMTAVTVIPGLKAFDGGEIEPMHQPLHDFMQIVRPGGIMVTVFRGVIDGWSVHAAARWPRNEWIDISMRRRVNHEGD